MLVGIGWFMRVMLLLWMVVRSTKTSMSRRVVGMVGLRAILVLWMR